MAFIIPIVTGAFGTAAAAIAAGTAGFSAYAMVAGTVLSGIGAITGKGGMQKLGAVLSLGAGIANWAGSASTAAAGSATGTAELAAGTAEQAGDLGFMAGDGGIATNAANTFDAGAAATSTPFGNVDFSGAPAPTGAEAMTGQVGGVVNAAAAEPMADGSLMSRAMDSQQASQAAGYNGAQAAAAARAPAGVTMGDSVLETGARGMTQADIGSYLKKAWTNAQTALGNPGQFIKDNKELVALGGAALNSAYGPQAQELAYRKSLMERVRRNLNSPVEIKYGG